MFCEILSLKVVYKLLFVTDGIETESIYICSGRKGMQSHSYARENRGRITIRYIENKRGSECVETRRNVLGELIFNLVYTEMGVLRSQCRF